MKYKILIPAALFMFFAYGSSLAQRDSKADKILKEVSAKYKSYKSLTADFKLEIENQKDKTKTTETGKIIIKGNMYKLELKDQEIVSDGKSIWTYLKEANEVQINAANSKNDDAISPTRIFTIYESGFRTKYAGEKKSGGIALQHIELVPEDSKKPYFKIQLSINKAQDYITSAKILNKDGTTLTYSVNKFNPDMPAPDNLFSFDTSKHPGVEVVDLR